MAGTSRDALIVEHFETFVHLKFKDMSPLDLKEPPRHGNSTKFHDNVLCSCTVLSTSLCHVKEQRKATLLGVKSPSQNVAARDTWRGSRMHALHLEPQQVAGSYTISQGSAYKDNDGSNKNKIKIMV